MFKILKLLLFVIVFLDDNVIRRYCYFYKNRILFFWIDLVNSLFFFLYE